MITIRNLVKVFGAVRAVDDVSLDVAKSSVTVILGPSGSGKSTVLRCINHLEEPTSGEIIVDGMRMSNDAKSINAIRAEVGMVFQQFNLFPHMTALQNIMLAQQAVRKRSVAEAQEIAFGQLTRVGIPEKASAFPSQLSGGQQQRVAIARALVTGPRLLVCDEPTSALDGATGQKVMGLIRELTTAKEHVVIVVTHDERIYHFADRIAHLDDGQVTHISTPAEALAESAQRAGDAARRH